jgi:hypothetical protein
MQGSCALVAFIHVGWPDEHVYQHALANEFRQIFANVAVESHCLPEDGQNAEIRLVLL